MKREKFLLVLLTDAILFFGAQNVLGSDVFFVVLLLALGLFNAAFLWEKDDPYEVRFAKRRPRNELEALKFAKEGLLPVDLKN